MLLLLLLLFVPLLHAQGPNSGFAPGSVWPSFGGARGGGRAVAGSVVGPTAIQQLSAQAWSSWSGTSSASLAAGPRGVVIYYTQGGMAPIGSIVRGRASCALPFRPAAAGSSSAPNSRLLQLICAHLSPPAMPAGVHSARPIHRVAGHPPL